MISWPVIVTRATLPWSDHVMNSLNEIVRCCVWNLVEKLQMSTAEIGLAVRTTNCLEDRGVFTVDDLLNCRKEDLLSISNFGEKTLEEVYKALEGKTT